MNNLSIIIPSRNAENLKACVEAIHQHGSGRIIVVDDGIDWGQLDTWTAGNLFAGRVEGMKPFCFARNVNLGIQAAGDDDVILLNDDALLQTAEGFERLHAVSQEHPEYGVIAACTNVANNQSQQPQSYHLLRQEPKMVCFVCVLIPRVTIEKVGLLEERFTGSIDGEPVYGGEDDDYCYRVRQAGLKVGIFDGCYVDHSRLKSTFRPNGGGISINATHKRFREIHGFRMGTR